MPLHMQVLNSDGKPRTFPNGIGRWHLMIAENMLSIEAAKFLRERPIDWELSDERTDAGIKEWKRVVRLGIYGRDHQLPITEEFSWEDPADGEVFTFYPGDRIVFWR